MLAGQDLVVAIRVDPRIIARVDPSDVVQAHGYCRGLLLTSDEQNYIRMERASFCINGQELTINPVGP